MSIHIIRADLSNLPFPVDFIVNTANPEPQVGNGLDKSIFEKAGSEMLEERLKIGPIAPGDIAITDAFGLNAKKVIHAVSIAWTDGFHDEYSCVQKCYHKVLASAVDYMQNHSMLSVSVAMPLLGTGIYQIPMEIAVSAAISESIQFALLHNMEIYIVLFSESSVSAMKKVFPVEEYITYKETREILEYEYTRDETYEGPDNIHEMIVQSDYFQIKMKPKSFLDLLRYYMNIKNMEAPQIYGSINLSRQSFSDIYGGKKMPKKDTVIRIAVQLNLSFDELIEFLEKAGYSLSDDKSEDRFVKEFFSLSERDIDLYNDLRIERGFGEI